MVGNDGIISPKLNSAFLQVQMSVTGLWLQPNLTSWTWMLIQNINSKSSQPNMRILCIQDAMMDNSLAQPNLVSYNIFKLFPPTGVKKDTDTTFISIVHSSFLLSMDTTEWHITMPTLCLNMPEDIQLFGGFRGKKPHHIPFWRCLSATQYQSQNLAQSASCSPLHFITQSFQTHTTSPTFWHAYEQCPSPSASQSASVLL